MDEDQNTHESNTCALLLGSEREVVPHLTKKECRGDGEGDQNDNPSEPFERENTQNLIGERENERKREREREEERKRRRRRRRRRWCEGRARTEQEKEEGGERERKKAKKKKIKKNKKKILTHAGIKMVRE